MRPTWAALTATIEHIQIYIYPYLILIMRTAVQLLYFRDGLQLDWQMIARCDTAIGLQGGLPASSHHQAKIDETQGTSSSKAGAGAVHFGTVGLVLEFQATVRRSAGMHVSVRDDADGEMTAPSCRPMWFTAEDNVVSLSVASYCSPCLLLQGRASTSTKSVETAPAFKRIQVCLDCRSSF